MAKIIDGKAVAAAVKAEVAAKVKELKNNGISVGLAVIIVGEDPASKIYVRNKKLACEACGINSAEYALPATTTEAELIALVEELNHDDKINGILVQMPLPKGIDSHKVIAAIAPEKDVDAFTHTSVGRLMVGDYSFLPCTPAGIIELIDTTGIEIAGKNCVVIGRSNIVGKPMAMMLVNRQATVTVCNSKTKNMKDICLAADILISAAGHTNVVTADMVKPGAVVIDVGMNRDENGKLCGDVAYDEVSKVAGYITPVPGGVGPMTIAMLMKNTLRAAMLRNDLLEKEDL